MANLSVPVLTPEQALKIAEGFREQFAVGSSQRDSNRELPYLEVEQLKQSGLLALRVPREYGGAEVDMLTLSQVIRHLAAGDPNITQAVSPQFTNLEKLRLYGREEQKRRYFSHTLSGGLMSNAAAEKGGNFIGDVSTRLQRQGQHWQLNGSKAYSTGSLFSSIILVTALHPDGGRAAVFVPQDRAGFRVLNDWDGMGQRTTSSGTTEYRDVVIEEGEILPVPAFGKRRTHEGAFAQLLHSAIDAGIAQAALNDACAYGRNDARVLRESGVAGATQDPYVLHTVGEMAIQTNAAIALLERGARLLDEALQTDSQDLNEVNQLLATASIAIAEAKYATTEASLRVSEMLFRLGGASATSGKLNLDRHWRNARTHTTHDPVSYKARAVGDFYLNGTLPPINTKI